MIEIAESPQAPTLTTERLELRELCLADARAVSVRAGDRRVARYLIAVPSPYPLTLASRWITGRMAWWSQGRGVTLAIARRDSPHELIGSVSLRRVFRAPPTRALQHRAAELGYWLGVDAWGTGYATEAASAMIDLGFAELGLSRIYAQVLDGNEASCRVLDKVGMINEGIRRRNIRKGKKLCDVVMFGLLRQEWRARL